MAHQPPVLLTPGSSATMRLCLGLLLWCGFIGWVGASSHTPDRLARPVVVDHLEQLAWAGNNDNPRVRPVLRNDGLGYRESDSEDPRNWDLITSQVTTVAVTFAYRSAYSQFYRHLPSSPRYVLPLSREPPTA